MNDAGPALSRLELAGAGHLSLHRTCLVVRSELEFEAMPLAAIAALRVAFERDSRRITWGAALVVVALIAFVIASPLGALSAAAVREMAGAGAGVARALEVFFRIIEVVASALPFIALAIAVGGALLVATGWRGDTVLRLYLSGTERVYTAQGHDRQMMEFGELVAEHLARGERGAEK